MGEKSQKRNRLKTNVSLEDDPGIRYSVKTDESKTALCWRYFGIAMKNDEVFDDQNLYCKLCFPRIIGPRYSLSTSTSNLNTHLQVEHKLQTGSLSSATRRTMNIIEGTNINVNKKAQLSRQIALWLCRDLRPFSTVSTDGFQQFAMSTGIISKLEDLPTDRAIAGSALNDVFLMVESSFKKELGNIKGSFSVLSDLWTDSSGNIPYINVSIQFMDENMCIRVLHVTTEELARPHTGEKIGQFIKNKVMELGLTSKYFYVTDGGRNMISSSRYMPDCIQRFNCLAHSINLAISSDLNVLDSWKNIVIPTLNLLKKTHGALAYKTQELKSLFNEQQAKEIFKYIEECEQTLIDQISADEDITDDTNEVLRDCFDQQLDLLNNFNMFKTSVATRWNTNLVMINSYIRNAASINSCLTQLNKRELILTQEQYETVIELQGFFQCFERTLKVLQSASEPTAHMVLLFRHSIIKQLTILANKETVLSDVYFLAIQSLEKRLSVENEWIIAAIVDPGQLKSNVVASQLEIKSVTIKQILLDMMQKLNVKEHQNSSVSVSNSIIDADTQEIGPAKRLRLEMLQDLESEESSNSLDAGERMLENEIDRYMLIASSYSRSDDILLFWKQNKQNIPNLYNLARAMLGLSVTSSFCEHAFSLSGALLNKKRSKLNPVRAQKQLFINANYDFYYSQLQK